MRYFPEKDSSIFPAVLPTAFSAGRALPPGIRGNDCDGSPFRLADASAVHLWKACNPTQQECLAAQFADMHADEVRDAILDLEDAPVAARASPADLLWASWIRFRNAALREMRRRGEFMAF